MKRSRRRILAASSVAFTAALALSAPALAGPSGVFNLNNAHDCVQQAEPNFSDNGANTSGYFDSNFDELNEGVDPTDFANCTPGGNGATDGVLGGGDPYEKLKRALRAEVDEAEWAKLYSARSIPFDPPWRGKVAVKVINHYGDEVLKVYAVPR